MPGNVGVEYGLHKLFAPRDSPWLHGTGTAKMRCMPGESPMWVVQASGVAALVQRILYSALCLVPSSFPPSAALIAGASPNAA